MPQAFIPIILWILLISGATVVVFGLDKRAARLRRRRVPEATLHLLELVGGWPGAIFAMSFLRHKNAKASYFLVTWLIAVSHVSAAAAVLWFTTR